VNWELGSDFFYGGHFLWPESNADAQIEDRYMIYVGSKKHWLFDDNEIKSNNLKESTKILAGIDADIDISSFDALVVYKYRR